ncbi:hypothetical protein P4S95_01895 [Aneurinibacillus aneurinilyticus]|nr:hypothetical protein [Aneurinibacillus aneurinilyticus]
MIIHKVEERRCTRRHVPSSFSYKEETRPLCGDCIISTLNVTYG